MKLLSWNMVLLFLCLASWIGWSVFAWIKLTTKYGMPLPPASPAIRFRDFEKAHAGACCKTMIENNYNGGHVEIRHGSQVIERVHFNYCPQCGKRFVEEKKRA